jgi:hypothetical protein
MEKSEGAQWTITDFLECCKVPVISHVTHLMRLRIIKNRSNVQFAFDLMEAESRTTNTELFKNPAAYIIQ